MRKLILALALLPSAALAGKRDPEWNPPAAYDHQFVGELRIHAVPVEEVAKTCQALYRHFGYRWSWAASSSWHGCSSGKQFSSCDVVVPLGPIMRATPAAILRHEVGHCNGWRHD